MSTSLRLFVHEVRTQQLLFWRNRESAIFVFVFPPLLFLLLGAVYNGKIDGFPAVDALLVGLVGYGCANTAFAGLAITLVIRRESGILKRVRGTPLPAATYLAAVLVSTLIVFLLQMLLTLVLGLVLYGAHAPKNWPGLGLALLLGVAGFAGLGFGATSLIRSGGGVVRRRQPDRAADGLPVRLVRPDTKLPRGAAVGGRRAAAHLPDRDLQERLPAGRIVLARPDRDPRRPGLGRRRACSSRGAGSAGCRASASLRRPGPTRTREGVA